MTMAMISPSGREVCPAEQLRQSPRLVPQGSALWRRSFVREDGFLFFPIERLHIVEDGHRRATRGPRGRGVRPGGRARPHPRGKGVAP